MLDDGPRVVGRNDFISFAKENSSNYMCNIILEALYPKGSKWKINGLVTNVELNGKSGVCLGIYLNEKLGI